MRVARTKTKPKARPTLASLEKRLAALEQMVGTGERQHTWIDGRELKSKRTAASLRLRHLAQGADVPIARVFRWERNLDPISESHARALLETFLAHSAEPPQLLWPDEE